MTYLIEPMSQRFTAALRSLTVAIVLASCSGEESANTGSGSGRGAPAAQQKTAVEQQDSLDARAARRHRDLAERRERALDAEFGRLRRSAVGALTGDALVAAQLSIIRTPEATDEQGFPKDDASGYGPVADLIPIAGLAGLSLRDFQIGGGQIVGYVVVAAGDLSTAYTALGIRAAGLYCVDVRKNGTKRWSARVWSASDRTCAPGGGSPTTLEVEWHRYHATPPVLPADYTAAAVWGDASVEVPGSTPQDEPTFRTQPTMIFRCGPGWCEIGPPGFESSAPPAGAPASKKGRTRGWYDRQVLAHVVGGVAVPSGIVGTIFPADNLELLGTTEYAEAEGRQVASITLESTGALLPPKYSNAGLQLGVNNPVRLRKLGVSADWEVKLGTNDWRKIGNPVNPGARPPGIVRWSWNPTDDDIWIRCGNDCCNVEMR